MQVYNSGQVGGCGRVARRVDGGDDGRGRRVRRRQRRVRRRVPAARRRLLRPAALRAHAGAQAWTLLVCQHARVPAVALSMPFIHDTILSPVTIYLEVNILVNMNVCMLHTRYDQETYHERRAALTRHFSVDPTLTDRCYPTATQRFLRMDEWTFYSIQVLIVAVLYLHIEALMTFSYRCLIRAMIRFSSCLNLDYD